MAFDKKKNGKGNKDKVSFPINDEIRCYDNVDVRVNYNDGDGEISRVMNFASAKAMAEIRGLDLIEINSKGQMMILRMADYGKFLFDYKKSQKKNKQATQQLKEVQLRTNISSHDLAIKADKAKKFLEDGDKVKVVLTMKSRELDRRDESKKCIYEFITMLEGIGVPESLPKDDGNKCIVIIKKKK